MEKIPRLFVLVARLGKDRPKLVVPLSQHVEGGNTAAGGSVVGAITGLRGNGYRVKTYRLRDVEFVAGHLRPKPGARPVR